MHTHILYICNIYCHMKWQEAKILLGKRVKCFKMEIKKYGGAFGVCHKPVHSEIKICMHQMHNSGAPSSP